MTRPANRLAHATSPYLLQHAHNPVDWYPWGEEALQKARDEAKPIFLSIGYTACHWCHVMERECFEDPGIAALLNASFVSIKVDREERPDLDDLYMDAVQALTGRGGWPMSVWLTPELEPFYGGTYIPPVPRHGLPSFPELLERIAHLWKERRSDIREEARRLSAQLRDQAVHSPGERLCEPGVFSDALEQLRRSFDARWGGFGRAPKFPPVLAVKRLLSRGSAEDIAMVTRTLDAMGQGGIYDHLGGGFARYSVDERWLVPHFEKMLYDNAQLVTCYLEAHAITGSPRYKVVARETLDYLLRDMRDPSGGFHSSEDADSEGEEGRFYVFTPSEVVRALGEADGGLLCEAFDVTPTGNFEGRNILNRIAPPPGLAQQRGLSSSQLEEKLEGLRGQLLGVRNERIRPQRDDKILTAWNGLTLSALAKGFQILGDPAYLEAATACAEFLQAELWKDGRLLRTWRGGRAHTQAFLEDYGALALGLVDLYESGFEVRWLRWAEQLVDVLREAFQDEAGGFWSTEPDQADLLFRQKPIFDNSLPSGNALAIQALLRLSVHLDRADFRQDAEGALVAFAPQIEAAPRAFLGLLEGLDLLLCEGTEIVVAGPPADPETRSLLRAAWEVPARRRTLSLVAADPSLPLHQGRVEDAPMAYVCRGSACLPPVVSEEALRALFSGHK